MGGLGLWANAQLAAVRFLSLLVLFISLFSSARTALQIGTSEGSKWVVPCKDVPFGGLYDVPQIWGSNPPKLKFLGSKLDFHAWTTKIQILITWKLLSDHDKFFTGDMHHECNFVGGPISPQRTQDGGRRPSWISWNANISTADTDICAKCGGKMHHGPAEIITWPKVETGS